MRPSTFIFTFVSVILPVVLLSSGVLARAFQPWCCPQSMSSSPNPRPVSRQTFPQSGGVQCSYGDDTQCSYHHLTGFPTRNTDPTMGGTTNDAQCPWFASFNGMKSCPPVICNLSGTPCDFANPGQCCSQICQSNGSGSFVCA
ncbi:hypothetical protein D9611_011676 [Ephemerocybe angulata]|uniref:Uncharacterized protein n=1 Tax=Ephemerocybe angulata TaxID=980116 RepID=A0A8H5FFM7_9AGAR|nr:hypothetical protein D9611_011676 [Tulosesus angulatus]